MKRSSILAIISLIFICANFISCDNFMNSGDIKKEIEDVIAFNNARVVNVNLACDEAVGTLFPNQTYQARVGYAFEVQFIPNTSDYKIKDYSKIFKADSFRNNTDRSDNVKIEVVEQSFEDKKSGVYRANITVTQYADDIRIRPECVAVPKISKITPENKKNGEDQDTPIIITFNKPMDAASFGDYSCISISSSEGNAWDYYDAPEFSDDKTQLTIQPKAGVLLLPPDEAKTADEITLSIDCTDIKDSDGLSLTQSSSYSFRINQSYGNKKVVELTVKVDDSSIGTITPEGKVSCNVGYTTTLQFELNKKEYILSDSETALKAVSANGGSVSFTTLSTTQTENTVIYTIKARVLKEANDIVITPNCIKVPKLVSITPQQISTGCDQDTPIKIKFNKAVDPESFGDFSCISISNENQDLKQYFGNPYFSENNTTLTIPTAQNTLILPPDGSKLQMDITVTIDSTNLKDEDNIALPQIEKYRYTINKNFGNQKKITVLIRTVEGTGTFLVDGERECVVGYSLGELQFTPNAKSAVFLGLEAVSKNDTSVSRNDSVEFTQVNNTNGVYIIRVRVKEEVNDILIRPKYILRPAIVDYSPKNTDYLSLPIFITFNEPVEDVSVSAENSVFNSSNVTIKCDNQTINNCFNVPSLNDTKDILSLTPKSEILTAFFRSRGLSTTDITVSFDSRTQFNLAGTQVQFAEDKSLSITIHYSIDFETTPPQKNSFGASRNWNASTSLPQDAFFQAENHFVYNYNNNDMNQSLSYLNAYTDSQILQNRAKGIVYIYGEYLDTESNVQVISVNEEYVLSKQSSDPTRNITIDYTSNSAGIINWETDNQTGITSYCIKHEIQHQDGTIQISVTVIDGCGNPSDIEYFTIFNVNSVNFEDAVPVNAYYCDYLYDSETTFDMDTFNDNVKNIKLIYDTDCNEDLIFEDFIFCAYYAQKQFDPDGIFTKIECEYVDDSGTLTTLPMTKFVYDQDEYPGVKNWNCTLTNVASVNGLKIKINVEDDLGNTGSMDYVFPLERTIESIQTSENTKSVTLSKMPDTPNYGLIIYKGVDEDDNSWKAYYDDITQFDIVKGYEYYYIANDSGYLTSELSSLYTYNSDFSIPDYVIDFVGDPEIQAVESGMTTIKVTIPQEAWSYYDNIFVKHKYDSYERYSYFESNATQLTITTYTKNLFQFDNTITVFGEKNKKCKQGESKSITVSNENDNVAPKISNDNWHWPQYGDINYLNIIFQEEETNIQSITFNGKSCAFTKSGNKYTVKLNVYDCIDYSTPQQPIWNFNLVATDEAENSGVLDQADKYIIKSTAPSIQTKDSSGITFQRSSSGGIIFYYFNTSSKKWILSNLWTMGANEKKYTTKNQFIIVRGLYSSPKYYYTGLDSSYNFKNSGKYDYILANGSSKTSVVVSSDAPVFVHTVVTTYPYDTCQYWTVDDWEFYKKTIGDEQFDFTARDQQKYNIPVEQINQYECYVVIAHFADGTSAMSDVMVKY